MNQTTCKRNQLLLSRKRNQVKSKILIKTKRKKRLKFRIKKLYQMITKKSNIKEIYHGQLLEYMRQVLLDHFVHMYRLVRVRHKRKERKAKMLIVDKLDDLIVNSLSLMTCKLRLNNYQRKNYQTLMLHQNLFLHRTLHQNHLQRIYLLKMLQRQ